jgi:polar amino acid transport system substrate-binding protein
MTLETVSHPRGDRARIGRAWTAPRLLTLICALAIVGLHGPAHGQEEGLGANADGGAASSEPRRFVIRFLTEGEFPPFNYYDDEGVLSGFNVDLARAICLEANAACDIKVRPWEELLVALRRGDADAVIAAHRVTATGLAEVEFSDRYFYTPGRFVVRKGDGLAGVSPDDLDGTTIGVAKGTAHEAFVKAFYRDSRIVLFENPELAREALQQGKVELIFDDAISLAFWLNGSLSRQCCEFKGGAFLEPKYFGDGLAVALPRNDPQIKTLINNALKRVRQSGRFQELVERYFPVRIY